MRKKIIALLLLFIGFFTFNLSVSADSTTFHAQIDDQAQLLTSQAASLEKEATSLANSIKASVYVVTTDTNTEKPSLFSRNYLAEKIGAGNNGIVMLIDMNQRETYLWATGNMQYYMTSSRINTALDDIQPELTAQNYDLAVNIFFDKTKAAVDAGISGRKYSVNPETGDITFYHSFQMLNVLVALFVALLLAGLFAWNIYRRYEMKDANSSVRYNLSKYGRLKLTQQQDILVNRFVTTRHIPRNNNSGGGGMSGGGGSGGGRSF
ncbi:MULTISPECIES: YgcG family protein [unclassified Lactococcus]|uniref:TPM domain-containing protein n=1 Tax=unclassified Lactococcus TaxID=2643510 RepID=UPI0011CB4180|nr:MULTISPECIES: TPM domain-containing protein [unclassified Lactococcus]MQW23869.1 hypothetical protein [Lactococcus sp. dk101]TXK37201.1 hypothetical protein FVP42_09470 [Lactococcus sp. dk310]TXK48116.1 hypothetical protein FVP43_09330 [Lactococcus sp. dk322]